MSNLPGWAYPAILACSLGLSLVLTPRAIAVALRFHVFDHPGPAKAHKDAVPYLGGAAIVVAFAVTVVAATFADPPPHGRMVLGGFLGIGVCLAALGLVDDVRRGLSPWLRLGFECAAGSAVWAMGYSPALPGIPHVGNAALTVLWVVVITNSFNLLDNMDGLSAGVAVIAASCVFGVAALQHRYLVAALSVALVGCAAGFLRHNFDPAKIYMGDAGSLFLGFMIAVLLLDLRTSAPTRVPVAVVMAIPGVAIFDTTLVMLARLVHGRSSFQGGQDHTSHRLVHMGLSVRWAVATTYTAAMGLGASALLMARDADLPRVVGVCLVLCGLAAAIAVWRAPVHSVPWAQAKGRRAVRALVREALPGGHSTRAAMPVLDIRRNSKLTGQTR